MTGKYPFSSGVLHNCNTVQPDSFLRPDTRCFSDVLHDANYGCGYIGKWHLNHPHPPYVEPPRHDGKVWDAWTPPQHRHGLDFWHTYGVFDQHLTPHYWTNETPREALRRRHAARIIGARQRRFQQRCSQRRHCQKQVKNYFAACTGADEQFGMPSAARHCDRVRCRPSRRKSWKSSGAEAVFGAVLETLTGKCRSDTTP